jgi:hypothetical protein
MSTGNGDIYDSSGDIKNIADLLSNLIARVGGADDAGRKSLNSVFGQKIIAHEISEFNGLFAYPADTRKLEPILNGSGTVGSENFMLKISTGTDADGSAIASSKRSLQYVPGHDGFAKFTAIFTPNAENSRQMIGLFDDLNGFAVGMEGSDFAIFRKRDGSIVETVTQSNFSEDALDGTGESGFNIDITKGNIFRINFGFLGFAIVSFEIFAGKTKQWIPFHIIDYPNNYTETHVTLPYIKLRASVENLGNTTDVIMRSGSVEAGIINGGGTAVSSRDFAFANSGTYASGTDTRIVVFHNKTTYGGISNRIESLLNYVSVATEGNKPVQIRLYKLALTPTGGTWIDKSINSTIETSIDTTIDVTGADLLLAFELSKAGQFFEYIEDLNIRMLPDDYIALTYTTTGAGDLNASIGWRELF